MFKFEFILFLLDKFMNISNNYLFIFKKNLYSQLVKFNENFYI